MKAKLSITGLVVVSLTLFLSFTPCSARPQHVRGHRHGDYPRRASVDQRSASSGSSLYIKTVGVTCKLPMASPHQSARLTSGLASNEVLVVPTPTVAVNITLEPTVTPLLSIIPFVVEHAGPEPLVATEFDVQQASESSLDHAHVGPYSRPQPIMGSTIAAFKLNVTSGGISTQNTPSK